MEEIFGWAGSVVAAMLFCELSLMLLPDGSTKRTAAFAFGILLLTVIAGPLTEMLSRL